jgi:hypothetical protein
MSQALVGANFTTAQASVTTTPAQIVSPSQIGSPQAYAGVSVKALAGNTQTIYVGDSSAVSSSNGYPLDAKETLTMPIDDPSKIWAVSASGTQILAIAYL